MILFTKGTENYFWSIKNSNDVLNKFKSKNFQASKLSTYDFSTLYTTLPNYLIKDKLIDLMNRTFIRENTQYLACNEGCAFITSDVYNNHSLWSCQKVCDALVYLLDNIFIRFGTKLYRQTIGIPMGTNCLFVLRFYDPVNPMGSCRARSVHLTTRLLGRLSPPSG